MAETIPHARRGLETVEFACGISQLLKGDNSAPVSTGVDLTSVPGWRAARCRTSTY